MTIPMLPDTITQMQPGLQEIGNALPNILNPRLQMQRALASKLVTDPNMRQQLIDMEAENPGSIAKVFGSQAAFLGIGTPSAAASQEIYNRGAKTKQLTDVANEGTLQSATAFRGAIGENPATYSRQKTEADVAAATAPNQITESNARGQAAQAAIDFQLGRRTAEDTSVKLAQDEKYRMLVNQAQQLFSTPAMKAKYPGGITDAMIAGDPNIDSETQMALMANPGIEHIYTTRHQMRMEELRQESINNMLNRQQGNADIQLAKGQAQSEANAYTNKLGIPINANVLFNIRQSGLEPLMDQAITWKSPQDQMQAAQQNPLAAKVTPDMIQTWQNVRKAQSQLQAESDDKDLKAAKVDYLNTINDINKSLGPKSNADQSVANGLTGMLQNSAYARIMRDKGIQLPTPTIDLQGIPGFRKPKLVFKGATGEELDPTTPLIPGASANNLDAAAKLVAEGKADLQKTLMAPELSDPKAKADFIARVNKYKKGGTP